LRLLVTGGAGFIGSNFVHHVLSRHPDYSVIVLDLLTYAGNMENLSGLASNPRFRFERGDICDAQLAARIMGGASTPSSTSPRNLTWTAAFWIPRHSPAPM